MKAAYQKTITSIFIVPTLKIERELLFKNKFINGFIADLERDEYHQEDVVFLLFKPKNLEDFANFIEHQYSNNPLLIEDYDYEHYVVLVYELQKQYKKDYKLIMEGKYSEVSFDFKEQFPRRITNLKDPKKKKIPSIQHLIFNKHHSLIDFWDKALGTNGFISDNNIEAWPTFDPIKEVLDIEKIIENEENNK